MPLKIITASDPITVDRLILCLYAPPGIGKTSLAFTAEHPLLLDFDRGAHRAAHRRDSVPVTSWQDIANVTEDDLVDPNGTPYATVIVDTAGRGLDKLSTDIIRRNPKMANGGALSLQGFGALKSEFSQWLHRVTSYGRDVILIAHMDEQRKGDEVLERLDVQGGSKNEIYKLADAMGRISIIDRKRTLLFNPTDAAFGKNPGQLDPLIIPHHDSPEFRGFLARVIAQIKARLNEMSEEQREAAAALEAWSLQVFDAADADGVNAILPKAKDAPPAHKALLHKRAQDLGLIFDSVSGAYVAKAA